MHPPKDFDVSSAIEAEEQKMKKVIYDQAHPAEITGGDASRGDGLMKKTKPTGNEIVDLLQSKDRGAHGLDAHLEPGAKKEKSHTKSSSSKSSSAHKHR